MLLKEGAPDFAVSRAYYSMYYCAKAMLWHRGNFAEKHISVANQFGYVYARLDDKYRPYHRMLLDARDDREDADYSIDPTIVEARAKQVIQDAEQFVELARQEIQ